MEERQWDVITDFGKFRVKHADDMVSVGGKDWCVNIVYKGPDESILQWLGTEDLQCTIDNIEIKGEKTRKMLYLATTIFRVLYRDVRYLHMVDSSVIKCTLPGGLKKPLSLKESHFLFHGKTYYEDKYGAFPRYESGKYIMIKYREGLHDPTKKPKKFSFTMPDLNEMLTPIYNSTDTWWDFFQEIQKKWGNKKCQIIYIWFRETLAYIGDKNPIPEMWTIDLHTLPMIRPTFRKVGSGVGRTRKRRGGNNKKNKRNKTFYKYFSDSLYENVETWNGAGIFELNWKKLA